MNDEQSVLPLEIDVHAVRALQRAGTDLVLLDCREEVEVSIARLDRSLHIPLRHIPARLAELEPHRRRRIVVYCHHGSRSLLVTQFLRERGFEAQNMAGGIDAWSCEVDRRLPRY
jgi:rhodanese-related sulfurtransferase